MTYAWILISFVMCLSSLPVYAEELSDQDWLFRAQQGDAEAIYMIGYKGIGEKGPNYYYEMAARKAHPQAITHMLDALLFRADENADVQKAKEFSDIARKMKIESQIYRNLDVVDICAKAGKPDVMAQSQIYPDLSVEACKDEHKDPETLKTCLLQRGNNIDMAMIYANGTYVKQDLWRAISYVCHGCSIPAELQSMVKTLHKATETGVLDQPFSFCDHATGTHSTTACYQTKVADDKRRLYAELDLLDSSFDEDEKKLYETLQKKAFVFFDIRAVSEQDLSGSMRGIFITQWELEQRQVYLETLKKLESHDLIMPYKMAIRAQKTLDQTYRKVIRALEIDAQKKAAKGIDPYIAVVDVEETQAAWVIFQRAFANFAAKRYPQMDQDHFKAWLFEHRTEQLNELLTGL